MMDINLPTYVAVPLAFILLCGIVVAYLIFTQVYVAINTKKAPDHESENFFKASDGTQGRFPSIYDPASVLVSVIVPAYNEEKRMTPMMDEMLGFLREEQKKDKKFTWEVVVVNDGSKDKTAAFVQDTYVAKVGSDQFRLLNLFRNNGKGGAVRKGMCHGRGQYLLMADADGATKASDLRRLLDATRAAEKDGLAIGIGSRAHMENEAGATANRSIFRRFLMWGFHAFITLMIGGSEIKDTQCGFKMFSRKAAQKLFPVQHIDRWAFDVELLFLAALNKIPMVEVPVHWHEVDGSKIDIVADSLKMARDICAIRFSYMFGVWKSTDENAPAAAAMSAPNSDKSGPASNKSAPNSNKSAPNSSKSKKSQ